MAMADVGNVRHVDRCCDRPGWARPRVRDDGSSLIEQVIAMTVIAAVLLGLLASLGATARSLTTGRQRTVAVSLAKQAIERLQGASYTDVAMNLASTGLESDPLVSGTSPNLMFEGERMVAGSAAQYVTTVTEAGTTFTLRTFVTAVAPATGTAYRRATVLIGWGSTTTGGTPERSMRFSSLIFPLDYTSYPSSSSTAEATGGSVLITGTLAGDVFEELRLALPGTRATTDSSTLRTARSTAAGATSVVDIVSGAVTSSTCLNYGDTTKRQCPRETADSVADNDGGTNNDGLDSVVSKPFSAASSTTLGGTTAVTPAGTMTSRATVGACGACGFGDSDDLPWSEASLVTTSSTALTFQVDAALGGTLWELDSGWSPSAMADDDVDGGGVVHATAQLAAPAAKVFDLLPGQAPTGFEGAVRLSGFVASASVASGHTTSPPSAPSAVAQVQLWDVDGYRTVDVTPGSSADHTASATLVVGNRTVAFTSLVQSHPNTTSTATSTTNTALRTGGVAEHTSLLLVTVAVTVTTGATVENFTIVFDYGKVSALTTWLIDPA
jgi:hypothetical protein